MAKHTLSTPHKKKKKTPKKHIGTPHDTLFKQSLKEIKIAQDFFKAHVPAHVYKALDLKTLQLSNKSYLNPELKGLASDVVYRCQIQGREGYIPILILSEHQSTDDPHMAFRMLEYTVCLMRDHLKAGHKRLPIVLPLCLYHGLKSPYPHSCDIYDDFDDTALAKNLVFKPFQLIDLTTMPLSTIQSHKTAAMMEGLLKIHQSRNYLQDLKELNRLEIISCTLQYNFEGYSFLGLSYVLSRKKSKKYSESELAQEFEKGLPGTGDKVMTYLQDIEQRGVQTGIREGIQTGINETNRKLILKMQAKHYSNKEIAEIMELTETEVTRVLEKTSETAA